MEGAMHPILHEIGEEHDGYELHDERQAADPVSHVGERGEGEHGLCREESEEGQHLHHETAHEVVEQVLAPFIPKDVLLRSVGKNPFHRDEEEAGKQDIEGKPIEAEENRGGIGGERGRSGAAEQRGEQGGEHAGRAKDFPVPQREAQGGQGKSQNQKAIQAHPKRGMRVQAAHFRHGQEARHPEGDDEQQTPDPEDEAEHPADPPATKAAQRRWGFQFATEFHASCVQMTHGASISQPVLVQ